MNDKIFEISDLISKYPILKEGYSTLSEITTFSELLETLSDFIDLILGKENGVSKPANHITSESQVAGCIAQTKELAEVVIHFGINFIRKAIEPLTEKFLEDKDNVYIELLEQSMANIVYIDHNLNSASSYIEQISQLIKIFETIKYITINLFEESFSAHLTAEYDCIIYSLKYILKGMQEMILKLYSVIQIRNYSARPMQGLVKTPTVSEDSNQTVSPEELSNDELIAVSYSLIKSLKKKYNSRHYYNTKLMSTKLALLLLFQELDLLVVSVQKLNDEEYSYVRKLQYLCGERYKMLTEVNNFN